MLIRCSMPSCVIKISSLNGRDSPTHFEMSSGPLTEIKFTSLSLAKALASRVFPVPGAPDKSIPLGGLVLALVNNSPCFRGHSTASIRVSFTFFNPPISSHLTSGTSTKTSLMAEGPTSFKASLKSSMVTSNWEMVS